MQKKYIDLPGDKWTDGVVLIDSTTGTTFPSGRLPVSTDERPSASAEVIVPHNTTLLSAVTRGIYVGSEGNLVALINGVAITFTNVQAGSILPIAATRVNATGTTSTGLVALY